MQQPQLPDMLERWQATLGWQPSLAQQESFQYLYEAILEGNRQLNLTRILAPDEFWEKHLWDSLNGIREWLDRGLPGEKLQQRGDRAAADALKGEPNPPFKVIDIGTGGGFPGLPVAIAQPCWSVTLLDSTRKKIAFLDRVIKQLDIPNAQTWVDRAELVGHHPQHREAYDLALIRAVASPSVCAEYALPLLKLGGKAILYRGQWSEAEAIELEQAAQQLGAMVTAIVPSKTPLSQSIRHAIHLQKVNPTPSQFPRAVGIPSQNPL